MPADLNDSKTARRILKALPIRSSAQVWGEEVYFATELALPEENLQAHVPPGTVAYWLPGKAICLFFGQTPASPVTIVGQLRSNPYDLGAVKAGDPVVVKLAPKDQQPSGKPPPAEPTEESSCDEG
jgi:hypothetical protein